MTNDAYLEALLEKEKQLNRTIKKELQTLRGSSKQSNDSLYIDLNYIKRCNKKNAEINTKKPSYSFVSW